MVIPTFAVVLHTYKSARALNPLSLQHLTRVKICYSKAKQNIKHSMHRTCDTWPSRARCTNMVLLDVFEGRLGSIGINSLHCFAVVLRTCDHLACYYSLK